ncbi:synaptotagmin-7 [Centruroides vittatus]|uniref:synaptotagmin-7 n=1 Tax=Centruroides vittatus TaxID=120091 RepID=UPI00350E9C97
MGASTILLAAVLGTVTAAVSVVVTLGFCFLYWKRRKLNKFPDSEEQQPLQLLQQTPVSECVGQATAVTPTSLVHNGNKEEDVGPIAFLQALLPSLEETFGNSSGESAGQIHFSLEYNFSDSNLMIKVLHANGLPAKDLSGTSDPYVRVCLLPDKKNKLETKVKHKTLNPRWNETFHFEGYPLHKLQKSILHFHILDYDRFTRDDSIGEVYFPLHQVDFTQKPSFSLNIQPSEKVKLGELLVSLSYTPRTSELTVCIIEARNLKIKDITGSSDPYVKIWLHRGDKRLEKKKTVIMKRSLNPVFNETFQFSVPWEHIRETSLVITVMDYDSIGRNEPIGCLVLSSRSGINETKHWNEMLSSPRTFTRRWHKLKPV